MLYNKTRINTKYNTQHFFQLPEYHVIILLNVLEVTAHDKSGLNEDTITKLIDFSIAEIQRTDLTQNVHSLASEILVVLGSKHCSKVRRGLLNKPEVNNFFPNNLVSSRVKLEFLKSSPYQMCMTPQHFSEKIH